MIHKKILNGLTLSLILTLLPTQAHAGWFTWIGDYFNKPSKNALVATTAIAGVSLLATFACALNWWKTSKLLSAKNTLIAEKDAALKTAGDLAAQKDTYIQTVIEKLADVSANLDKTRTVIKNTESELLGKNTLIKIRENQLAQAKNQVNQLTDSLNQAWTHAQQNGKKVQEELAAKDAQLADEQYKLHQRNVMLESSYRAQVSALEMQNETLKKRLQKLAPYEKQSDE